VIFETASGPEDVARVLVSLALSGPRPVLTLVGGAGRLDDATSELLAALFADVLAPAVAKHGAAAVDGGTGSGVIRLFGRARAGLPEFPLIGVAAGGTVEFPGNTPTVDDFERLDHNHTHFVMVPGGEWGAESPYLPMVAAAVAAGGPTVTVLVNGGDIALDDGVNSIERGIPVLVLSGTGRAADQIAAAVAVRAGGATRASRGLRDQRSYASCRSATARR
jgi:SLOG in TRPM, prokaryote